MDESWQRDLLAGMSGWGGMKAKEKSTEEGTERPVAGKAVADDVARGASGAQDGAGGSGGDKDGKSGRNAVDEELDKLVREMIAADGAKVMDSSVGGDAEAMLQQLAGSHRGHGIGRPARTADENDETAEVDDDDDDDDEDEEEEEEEEEEGEEEEEEEEEEGDEDDSSGDTDLSEVTGEISSDSDEEPAAPHASGKVAGSGTARGSGQPRTSSGKQIDGSQTADCSVIVQRGNGRALHVSRRAAMKLYRKYIVRENDLMYAEMNAIVNRLRTEPPCSVYFRSEIPLADVLKSLGPLVFWGDDYDKEFLRSVKSEDDKDLPEDYKTSFRLCDPLLPDRFKKRMREIMLSRFMLPVMFVTCHCGFESFPEMELSRSAITAGEVVLGGRYRVLKFIGQSVFCRTVKAVDLESGRHVCVKIIKNQKPYFDQGLDEVKVLKHLSEAGELDIVLGSQFVYKMLDYFYFREHLMIVTELMECDLYVKNKTWMHKHGISFFTLERVRRFPTVI